MYCSFFKPCRPRTDSLRAWLCRSLRLLTDANRVIFSPFPLFYEYNPAEISAPVAPAQPVCVRGCAATQERAGEVRASDTS